MSNEVAVQDLSREKVELIKQTVAKGATDLELQLFFHACQRTGLDPLMKQIYAIKRWDAKLQREAMAIQTGIDGYRLIADRTGNYAPGPKPTFTYDDGGALVSATAYVKKRTADGDWHIVEGEAFWEEYVQRTKTGEVTSMWQKGHIMLSKCAESNALRRAFPAELSGIYTHEEMMQADNGLDHKPSRKPSDILKASEQGAVLEPSVKDYEADLARAGASPAPLAGVVPQAPTASAGDEPAGATDDIAAPYRRKIINADDEKACTAAYQATPEPLKQEVHSDYFDTLKRLSKRKK